MVLAIYTCLLLNSFVGFQFIEDGTLFPLLPATLTYPTLLGTNLSLWFLRIACLTLFGAGYFLAIATFKSLVGFSPTSPVALYIAYIIYPVFCVVVYVVSQLILVFRMSGDWWAIGDIVLGSAAFAMAQVHFHLCLFFIGRRSYG